MVAVVTSIMPIKQFAPGSLGLNPAPVATNDTIGSKVALDRAHLLDHGIIGFEQNDIRSQTFQMLRSQLLRRLGRSQTHIVAVTSTQSGNGKSFIAANLAAALSQIHPVWIVDLDLRRPCVADRFGVQADTGVDDYLLGALALGERECLLNNEQLTILPVGQPRANSAEILSSARTAELFTALRNRPEKTVCIIDTPPVLEGDDMMIIAQHVDSVLLVVEEGRTPRSQISNSLRMLHPTPIIGTVLNKSMFPNKSSSYGKYYGREAL
jgi:protein-tyrosine kinase